MLPGNAANYGATPNGSGGNTGTPERLGRFDRQAFGQDRIGREGKAGMLLGAAERQHGAVVVPHPVLDHLPVHVGDAHAGPPAAGDRAAPGRSFPQIGGAANGGHGPAASTASQFVRPDSRQSSTTHLWCS